MSRSKHSSKTQDGGIKNDEKRNIGGIKEVILEEIRNNPGIFVVILAKR